MVKNGDGDETYQEPLDQQVTLRLPSSCTWTRACPFASRLFWRISHLRGVGLEFEPGGVYVRDLENHRDCSYL